MAPVSKINSQFLHKKKQQTKTQQRKELNTSTPKVNRHSTEHIFQDLSGQRQYRLEIKDTFQKNVYFLQLLIWNTTHALLELTPHEDEYATYLQQTRTFFSAVWDRFQMECPFTGWSGIGPDDAIAAIIPFILWKSIDQFQLSRHTSELNNLFNEFMKIPIYFEWHYTSMNGNKAGKTKTLGTNSMNILQERKNTHPQNPKNILSQTIKTSASIGTKKLFTRRHSEYLLPNQITPLNNIERIFKNLKKVKEAIQENNQPTPTYQIQHILELSEDIMLTYQINKTKSAETIDLTSEFNLPLASPISPLMIDTSTETQQEPCQEETPEQETLSLLKFAEKNQITINISQQNDSRQIQCKVTKTLISEEEDILELDYDDDEKTQDELSKETNMSDQRDQAFEDLKSQLLATIPQLPQEKPEILSISSEEEETSKACDLIIQQSKEEEIEPTSFNIQRAYEQEKIEDDINDLLTQPEVILGIKDPQQILVDEENVLRHVKETTKKNRKERRKEKRKAKKQQER